MNTSVSGRKSVIAGVEVEGECVSACLLVCLSACLLVL